jgi:hypothetical protein
LKIFSQIDSKGEQKKKKKTFSLGYMRKKPKKGVVDDEKKIVDEFQIAIASRAFHHSPFFRI